MFLSENLLHEVMDGGATTTEGRIPSGIHANCTKCDVLHTFQIPNGTKISGGTLGFGRKCHRCKTNNQFIISYELDGAPGRNPISAYQILGLSQTSDSSNIDGVLGKAIGRLSDGDYEGSITSSYTMLEKALKIALVNLEIEHKVSEGNVNKLFSAWAAQTGNSARKGNEAEKVFLSGLSKVVEGIYKVANSSGDRHDSVVLPTAQTAQATLDATLCIIRYINSN